MVSGLNMLLRKLRNTGSTIGRQGSEWPRSARTDDNANSVNEWFWVMKVHQRATEPQVKLYERQEFITIWYTVSFVRIEVKVLEEASCARKNSLLQTVRCTELAHENCYVVSQHPLWTSYFFTDENIFTLAPPVNLQNNRVYVPTMTKKCELSD